MHQTALRRAVAVAALSQRKMKYCDMHCDALTNEGVLQVKKEYLQKSECFLQCFAVFVQGDGAFTRALSFFDRFDQLCEQEGYCKITRKIEMKEGEINALLTVEGSEAIEGDLAKLERFYARGVRMMTLTWNYPNEIGFPNFPDYRGLLCGKRSLQERESVRGLTEFGRQAVERMNEIGMIIDVSHGSDALLVDVAECSKQPFVASHSNAQSVWNCARNLSDGQIHTIADCGGVVGLNFCADFLSNDCSAEGQRRAMLAHLRAILNAGGEDVVALGSDFDGIPANAYLPHAGALFKLFAEVEREFGARLLQKFTRDNFLRVFGEVCK